ncbi:hypothetical protein IW261DRAFT_1556676 [Armillaria novae-zelandiae]|uniref:Uncharacterized protein n=1 Tax=Armillaria novae-zelandiae TaxID=153914 RepID=A0AA39UJ58_9AGAR|nr:hypothetical protein IW261DRAFT_1556676 [Armillaria novae-zelandiae]
MPRPPVVILLVITIGSAMHVHSFQRSTNVSQAILPLATPQEDVPYLIDCILDSITSGQSAGLSAGASISALLPTVLALVGASPIELMEVIFSSPLCAVAMCVFGIGLPSGLFRQLHPGPVQRISSSRTVTRSIHVRQRTTRRGVLGTYLADLVILTLAGVMLWRTWLVGSITMVTFRCEYSWLLFCWPMACLGWLVIAILGRFVVARNVSITFQEKEISWREALLLPYRVQPRQPRDKAGANDYLSLNFLETEEMVEMDKLSANIQRRVPPDVNNSAPAMPLASHLPSLITVTFTMRWDGLWQWYEAALETLAVVSYSRLLSFRFSFLFVTEPYRFADYLLLFS